MLKQIQPESIRNILVVRQHNQIGDIISSLPLYAALKKEYADAKITLIAAKTNYPIPFFDINPYLDRVITFDKSSLFKILKFLWDLWRDKYQIGIVPSTIKLSRTSHIINFLSGAKFRIGVNSIDSERNPSTIFLNIKSDFFWNSNKVHQSERNLDIVKQIGLNLSKEEIEHQDFSYTADDKNFAQSFFENNFHIKEKIIVGVHPGAGKEKNVWNYSNFFSLLKKINEHYNPYFLVTTGVVDNIIAKNLQADLNKAGIQIKILDSIPPKKLALILAKINLYITNDTGTMHIAGVTNVNQISLFGPTRNYEWAPKGKNKFHIQSKSENINDITVEEVFGLCSSILNKDHEVLAKTGS